jgi:zinc/manganese transport system permease protein
MEQIFYLPATMLWPLAACLVLTGIHVYLGVHVIARKVIFVDLALAQIAALGTVIGVLLGYEVGIDTTQLYLYSLAFTIFGAFIFSITRMKREKVPHEAIIGIVYAVTFAATILVLSRSALGPQELDHIIKGELLWVQGPVVIKTAIIYALVGLFHFIFRKKFMAISFEHEKSSEEIGINVPLWDFLFYMSFGFVITSSVAIAGVFLVFSYLVIPSVGAMLLSDKLSTRLTIGWLAGAVVSFIGVKLSWMTGLPTSPLIVVILALGLMASALVHYFRRAPRKVIALRNIAVQSLVGLIFIGGIFFFRKPQEDPLTHTLHMMESRLATDRLTALSNLGSYTDKKSEWLPAVLASLNDQDAEVRRSAVNLLTQLQDRDALHQIMKLLNDQSDEVRRSAVSAARILGGKEEGDQLVELARKEDDVDLKVFYLRNAMDVGVAEAIPLLAQVMNDGGIFADDAYDAVKGHVPLHFDKTQGGKLLQWWNSNRRKLSWNEKTKEFEVTGGSSAGLLP